MSVHIEIGSSCPERIGHKILPQRFPGFGTFPAQETETVLRDIGLPISHSVDRISKADLIGLVVAVSAEAGDLLAGIFLIGAGHIDDVNLVPAVDGVKCGISRDRKTVRGCIRLPNIAFDSRPSHKRIIRPLRRGNLPVDCLGGQDGSFCYGHRPQRCTTVKILNGNCMSYCRRSIYFYFCR